MRENADQKNSEYGHFSRSKFLFTTSENGNRLLSAESEFQVASRLAEQLKTRLDNLTTQENP